MRKYERHLEHFAQFLWSWLLINNVETTHSLIFKQDEVSIKAICAEVKTFVSFGNFMNQRSRLSRIGFIQSPKDEILILQKKKLIASKLASPKPKKPKKFKEMGMRIPHQGALIQDLYDRAIGNAKQGSSCEVCQQTIGEWGHYPAECGNFYSKRCDKYLTSTNLLT